MRSGSGSGRARDHHYVFAHHELRRAAARFGADFPDLARDGRFDRMLHRAWTAVGEQLAPDVRLPPDGLSAAAVDLDDHAVALVTMPPASYATEAHYAAVAVSRADRSVRYLLLEYGVDLFEDRPYTVLTEWVADTHVNLGAGPAVDPAAFMGAVASRLAV